MFGHIYYTIGLFVLLSLLTMILKFKNINSVREWFDKFKIVTGKDPEEKDFRNKEERDLYKGIAALSVFEFLWVIGGLLTSSWYIFIFLLLYSVIITQITKPIKYTIIEKIVSLHFFLLKFFVYLFLIINHFHLHYDVFSIIKNYIK